MELHVLLEMPVLESGSLGLPGGGGVMEEMGLPFSSLTSGESGLQPTGEATDAGTPEGSCRATKATAAVSLD